MYLEMYLLTLIFFQKDSTCKYQFYTKFQAPSRLVSQVYVWARYKDEVPDVSGSSQNFERPCNTKLKFKGLKNLCFKSTEKLAEMNVCNRNIKTLTFQRRRYHFRLWVFASNSECFYCWSWSVLPNWCKRLSKTSIMIAVSFYA